MEQVSRLLPASRNRMAPEGAARSQKGDESTMIYFTADTHFGHARIIDLAKRPFHDVEEMDAHMIDRWNCVVRPGDTVYHLGDFAFAPHDPYLKSLNGEKHLIKGNHDHSNRVNRSTGWASVRDMANIKLRYQHGDMEVIDIVLCHYGLRVWNKSHHGALHFYGHSHGSLPGDSQSCDVGVDCWNFEPVSLGQIREHLATLPKRATVDHHVPPSQ